ncbi:MAG: amidohydrolase family protein [Planctomycetaceae bacterium]
MRNVIAFSLCFACSTIAVGEEVTAYTNATVETVGKAGQIENATVVVRGDKIEAVGKDVTIPNNARIIDVSGHTLMPGVVDPYFPINMNGAPANSGRTITIGGRTFRIGGGAPAVSTAFTRIVDNLDPLVLKNSQKLQSRVGVGFANLVTRGYGQAAHARVTPADVESSILSGDGYLYAAVTNSTRSLDLLRKNLGLNDDKSKKPTTTRSASSSKSPTAKLWAEVKDGKKPVLINVNSAAAILHVLKALEKNDKIKVAMVATGPHIYDTIDEIKKRKNLTMIVKAGLDTAPRSRDRINVPAMLADGKVKFAFSMSLNTDVPSMTDTPMFPLAMLVKTGLDRDKAISALTLEPAKILGLEKTLGSIEKGKKANIIFVDGDPLDMSTRVQKVLVEGKTVYEG